MTYCQSVVFFVQVGEERGGEGAKDREQLECVLLNEPSLNVNQLYCSFCIYIFISSAYLIQPYFAYSRMLILIHLMSVIYVESLIGE